VVAFVHVAAADLILVDDPHDEDNAFCLACMPDWQAPHSLVPHQYNQQDLLDVAQNLVGSGGRCTLPVGENQSTTRKTRQPKNKLMKRKNTT
jgi:hypothetical protein